MRAIVRLMTVPPATRDLAWLKDSLQAAIQLELGTIPPYLYAAWSITDPSHPAADVIGTIAIEEMFHMAIACNLLAAVGGMPDIPAAASTYPTTLPKDVHQGLSIGLAPLSKDLLLHAFMVIEEPQAHLVTDPDFAPTGSTLIGDFYDAVQAAFIENAPAILLTARQLDLSSVGINPPLVNSLDAMRQSIELIKRQGEGNSQSPFSVPGELAHFYQFAQIFHGRELQQVAGAASFSYSGNPVEMPAVTPLQLAGPESAAFNQIYSDLLRQLQQAWNLGGGPGSAVLGQALGTMGALRGAADALTAQGKGPSFVYVSSTGLPQPKPAAPAGRFSQVRAILDRAVGQGAFGAHGPFWRGKTRDQFVQQKVFGKQLLVVGNGRDSNLTKALRGQPPFGSDAGTAGATFRRMPAGLPAVPPADIDFIEAWINDGCPDDTPATFSTNVSLTTGGQRPDPSVHLAYWRELDDWSMFHATPEVQEAEGIVFGFFPAWQTFAKDPATEASWLQALQADEVRAAVAMLASRQKQTMESHYGLPVPLLAVLDGFERFGNNGLPPDPLRPADRHHTMNGPVMWFIWSAFASACVALDISPDFWRFSMRAILCGLLNDGTGRKRFPVIGFTDSAEDRLRIFAFCQTVADADLPGELRRRYVDSGL